MKEGASGLYIREAQYAHEGEYTCEAQTPLQVDTRTAKVTVRGQLSTQHVGQCPHNI
ncbi:hypothetical protein DPMN_167052 [Dreissena polymorpha]|uniref:Immunoglobulin I-set domain-containing protein n=1 Tax=Dreissena polymorpha TaxID=45954 RepID=A0A9D4EZP2_DREPO|nr:hypothetical protein DPMN_167052 [Dreissena polymorpha]